MKLDELQSVQSRERQTDQLQQLRATFYEEAGQFVQQLREERDRAADRAEDPFDSPEVNRLTDDIKTAEQTVEAIYERRVGKIVKMASLAAADMPTEEDGLTQKERDLFETMVDAIKANRGHVLDVIAGEAPTGAVGSGESESSAEPAEPAPTAEQSTQPADDAESGVDPADMMGGAPSSSGAASSDSAAVDDPTAADGAAPPEHTDVDRPADEAAAAIDDAPPSSPPADAPPAPQTAAADGDSEPEADAPDGDDVDRRTVRITADVGEIFGVDQREYDLSADDVVTLPADNADPLVDQDAAEPLE